VVFVTLLGRLEVGQEVVVWLDGDNLAVCAHIWPNSESRSLRRSAGSVSSSQKRGKSSRSARGEVLKERAGSVDGGLGRGSEALYFFLQCLAAHDVLGFGEVAEDVEVA
jgi:hypothetical protein